MSTPELPTGDAATITRQAQLRTIRLTRTAGLFNMMTAVAFMVAALLQSRKGQSGAVWIALGAAFIALGGGALGRAKKLADDMKEPPKP